MAANAAATKRNPGIHMIARSFFSSGRNRYVRLQAAATPMFGLGGGSEENEQFMIVLVVVCVAAMLFLGMVAWRARQVRRRKGQVWKDDVLDTLQRVMSQHGRLDMYPMQRAGNANAPTLSGRCVACSREGLKLDCELTADQSDWPYAVVDIYFHENRDTEQIFYAFTASIRQTIPHGNRLIVELPLPMQLRQAQKRAQFRVIPPPIMLFTIILWPVNEGEEQTEQTDAKAMGRPLCAYQHERLHQITMLDISAGGVLLQLDAECCRQLKGGIPRPGDFFHLLVVLADRQGAPEPRRFWFRCLCCHASTPSGKPRVGLQFQAWSLTEKTTDPIIWHDLEENGEVPPLSEWLLLYASDMPLVPEPSLGGIPGEH
jgi:hypothetical protein